MKRFALILVLSLVAAAMFAQNLTVYDVQYTTDPDGVSPHYGENVVVEGVVCATLWKGYASFFICDPDGGEWSGVLVYDGNDEYGYDLTEGDFVVVSGYVDEYYGMTEISNLTDVTTQSSGNTVPDPVVITTSQLASEECYEGCLVRVNDVTVTQEQNEYGEWYVDDYARNEAQIDDGFFYLDELEPPVTITVGDEYDYLIGMVDYSYDIFALNPRTPQDMGIGVDVDDNMIEATVAVKGNYPNPFNPETTIVFSLAEPTTADLAIYNVRGQKVRSFGADYYESGEHQVRWNGTNDNGAPVSSGVYFFKIGAGRYTATKKMILLK